MQSGNSMKRWPDAAGQLNSMLGSIKLLGFERSDLSKVGDIQC